MTIASSVGQPDAPRISDAEFASVQRTVDAIVDRLAEQHLSLAIETDFTALYRFLSGRPGAKINPTFSPFESDLSRDSFWLRVIDANGNSVACHAQRVFVVDDFCELLRNGRLFSTVGQPFDAARSELLPPSRLISGRVAHAGSLWVDAQYRKQGLSVWLPYLSRLACLRNYDPDFFTACVFEGIASSGTPAKSYGYTHIEQVWRGFFPPTGTDETLFMCYMTWRDAVEKIKLLAAHPQYPIDPDRAREAAADSPPEGAAAFVLRRAGARR